MKNIIVNTSKEYEVIIGQNILKDVGKIVKEKVGFSKVCIITDDVVDKIYGESTVVSFINEGFSVDKYVIIHGEQSKNSKNFLEIISFLAEKQYTRTDVIVALGGGVVGDLAGFCAATYMRGIRFVQIPTTLLAAVDSSVGGKTAVDLPQGKNLLGAFWQPSLVMCDTNTLDTLNEKNYADGVAEIIKYGMIYDKKLFDTVKTGTWNREEIIARCIKIKRDVVNCDEFENGLRQILNFGHTFGHGIETLSNFELTHGESVAIGMSVLTYSLTDKGEVDNEVYYELINALKNNNLPYTTEFSADDIFNKVINDKKRNGDFINIIVVKEIGNAEIVKTDLKTINNLLDTGVKCGK